jgi:hypothetical protein
LIALELFERFSILADQGQHKALPAGLPRQGGLLARRKHADQARGSRTAPRDAQSESGMASKGVSNDLVTPETAAGELFIGKAGSAVRLGEHSAAVKK